MKTMNKFIKYFLLFILSFLFVSLFIYLGSLNRTNNIHNINYVSEINTSIKLNVTECKASNNRAFIKGSIINETGEIITNKYLQFCFYSNNGYLLGANFKKLQYFNATEEVFFDTSLDCSDVESITISLVDENIKNNFVDNYDNSILSNIEINKTYALFAGVFALYILLP